MIWSAVLAAGPSDLVTTVLTVCGLIVAVVAALKSLGEGLQMLGRGRQTIRNWWMSLTKPWRLANRIEEQLNEDPEEALCKRDPPDKS